ncbi:MAG: flagellar biosynthesis protein FlhF [Desulfobulbus propionicus]|nr:MAG: flagellar biosynthesis protein FlhF [Desulfobulbus propionicus]
MQVRVFEAEDMASGLKKVKQTFGPDALILSTKKIRRGKMGMLSKPYLEITAAIDNRAPELPVAKPDAIKKNYLQAKEIHGAASSDLTYEKLFQQSFSHDGRRDKPGQKDRENEQLKQEINELKHTLSDLTGHISTIKEQMARSIQASEPVSMPYIEPEYFRNELSENHASLKPLLAKGLDHSTAAKVMATMEGTGNLVEQPGNSGRDAIMQAAIARLITTEKILCEPGSRQQRLSLIGPTGAGKTTTIAKLAANYLQQYGGKVAFLTIDTYRIAAVEQLKVYAEIMKLPLKVVLKPEEIEHTLQEFADYDLILIDTAGRSPKNTNEINDLQYFFRPSFGIEHHLLLSASTRDGVLIDTINRFSILPISSFIFSKIDECDQLGVILNIHQRSSMTPVSFLTNGQRVPEDITAPNPAEIAQLIVNTHRTQ